MESWKRLCLRRLGMGLFTSCLLQGMNMINSFFEGTVILLLVSILLYVVDIEGGK